MRGGNQRLSRASASGRLSSAIFVVALVSVTANILFAGMLFRNHAAAPAASKVVTDSARANSASENPTGESQNPAAENNKDPLADFRWSQIEDTDRQQYIKNLR